MRPGADAFPDVTEYPSHPSCLNCHQAQFFNGRPPAICTICHVSPSPRNSTRYPFPNPLDIFEKSSKGRVKVSDFLVYFPHDKHADVFGLNLSGARSVEAAHAGPRRVQEDACATCHTTYQPQGSADEEFATKPPANNGDNYWLKKGTFKTTPRSHKTCFECHSSDGDISPKSSECASCHRLPPVKPEADDYDAKAAAKMSPPNDRILLNAWRRRDSSATFRHEIHADNKCTVCHKTGKMNTTDVRTLKVPVMSCGGDGSSCHITPTTDDGGALNFEIDQRQSNPKFQCVKCHITLGKKPIPPSHTEAVAAMKGK